MVRFARQGSWIRHDKRATSPAGAKDGRWRWGCILLPIFLAACATGDFDRVKPELVADDTHAWLGIEAASRFGGQFSTFQLTDEERTLRDLAYPLIGPPFDRQRWYSIVGEYGVRRFFDPAWLHFVLDGYQLRLTLTPYRSANARYNKLNEDVRDDVVRIGPFFDVARRVLDMDNKRAQSLSYVVGLAPREYNNALSRNMENALVIAWVQCSLSQRAASYQYALEHLVVSTPSPVSVEVERSVTLLQTRIAEHHVLDEPSICTALPAGSLQIVSKR
jgi:hypothetical protein